MMNTVRVGMLGVGGMGKNHANCLKKMDGVKISAICGLSRKSTEIFCEDLKLSNCNTYNDFDEMLENETLDALYVCIPPFAHDGQVIKAAEKGIHLFLEKPIALNVDVATEMVDAIEKAEVVSQVGYQMRFRKSIQRLAAMVADGTAGRPTLFQGRFWCRMDGAGPAWWPNKDKSGGQILEQIIHIYDLALYLFGEPESAAGWVRNLIHNNDPAYTIEDTSIGMVSFKNGACASITGSNCAAPVHFIGDYQVVFENVTLNYKSTGQHWVTPDESVLLHVNGECETFTEDENVYELEDVDFIQAIREKRAALAPARDGLNDIRIIEQVVNGARKECLR